MTIIIRMNILTTIRFFASNERQIYFPPKEKDSRRREIARVVRYPIINDDDRAARLVSPMTDNLWNSLIVALPIAP